MKKITSGFPYQLGNSTKEPFSEQINVMHNKVESNVVSMPSSHSHEYYEVYYLMSGERYFFLEDTTYHIQTGNLILIKGNAIHQSSNCNNLSHERIAVHYDWQLFERAFRNTPHLLLQTLSNQNRILPLDIRQQSFVQNIMLRMVQEYHQKLEGHEEYLIFLLSELLMYLGRIKNLGNNGVHEKPTTKLGKEIMVYIQQHYTEPITLSSVADTFYISKQYLSQLFKKMTGITFTSYVNLLRIRKAQDYLRETNVTIIDISSEVGFTSVAHFGRVFKEITMYTPSSYRKMHSKLR